MRLPALIAVAAALGVLTGGARAQPGRAPSSQPPGWEFSVTPYAWLPAVRGTVQTPLPRVGDQSFGLGSGTVVSDLDALPVMIAGEARYGRFSVTGDFFYAALQQDLRTRDLLFEGGHTRVRATVGTLLGTFRVLDEPRQSLELGAGTRIWGLGTKVSLNAGLAPGAIRKTSVNWADPLVAARYHAMLSPRLGVSVYADIGGFDAGSRLTWQAIGSVDYSISDRTTLRAGWRYLTFDKARGDFALDLSFNGPFFAVTFRF